MIMNGGSPRKCPQCWMIDNIGPRILTSGSFSRDNDNTRDNGGHGGGVTSVLCLNYVGGGDTDLFLLLHTRSSHLLKHLENISGGQSIIN